MHISLNYIVAGILTAAGVSIVIPSRVVVGVSVFGFELSLVTYSFDLSTQVDWVDDYKLFWRERWNDSVANLLVRWEDLFDFCALLLSSSPRMEEMKMPRGGKTKWLPFPPGCRKKA